MTAWSRLVAEAVEEQVAKHVERSLMGRVVHRDVGGLNVQILCDEFQKGDFDTIHDASVTCPWCLTFIKAGWAGYGGR